ncbi:MAG: LysR family transcriptional regulator [Lachnospiraceae bacterium]|nr:LysR family transcriptional regulator [Lachnospiraceae bacterium]
MTFQQLHYVIVISETGSINKASEVLYISQPSLTAAVQELEKDIGIKIFQRSGRGVTLTNDGREFLLHAREVYAQYEQLVEKYEHNENLKAKFSVSTQHYSFAVKAFVELVKKSDTSKYEFAIMETKTRDVISDVATLKSEIGILYLSNFNRTAIQKLLRSNRLEFTPLIHCQAYVYLWKGHPLAKKRSIRFEELSEYPCVAFDQGDNGSFYFAEEILSTNEYPRIIRTNDRATNLNLMVGLNGYTLCSGIISEELNGDDYVAIPFQSDRNNPNDTMEIGFITRKNNVLSKMGERYVEELRHYLRAQKRGKPVRGETPDRKAAAKKPGKGK